MSFEGQYLSYQEYQSLGGTLEETPFNILEFEIRKQVDLNTQNRLKEQNEIPVEVKLCEFNLISKLNNYQNELSNNIASETVGDYSISYNKDIKQIIENMNDEITNIIITNLYGIVIDGEHLIFRGV